MIARLATSALATLILLPAPGQAQTPAPGAEHEALAFWIGSWRIEAQGFANPLFPEGQYAATLTAEWFPGQSHVLCKYEWTGALGPYSELNVLGYDPTTDAYYSFAIDSFGGGTVFRGPREGKTWIYSAEMDIDGDAIVFRWTVTDASPGVITWTSEISVAGGPWILAGEARATRQ
jgi:hypothetical protein